jgi:biotin carboxyl carrier protein
VGIGRVEARRIHQLSSVVAARLVSLSADIGDRVQAGQQVGVMVLNAMDWEPTGEGKLLCDLA